MRLLWKRFLCWLGMHGFVDVHWGLLAYCTDRECPNNANYQPRSELPEMRLLP